MSIKNNIEKEPAGFQHNAGNELAIDQKLDELIHLLSVTPINADKAKDIKHRVEQAIKLLPENYRGNIQAFQSLDIDNVSREDLLNEFSILLLSNQVDTNVAKKYIRSQRFSRLVLIIISIVMIVLGFGMIIMPAPPFFEMYTIFYFNQNDGITIMDLISLLIVLFGIYFLVRAIHRNPSGKK